MKMKLFGMMMVLAAAFAGGQAEAARIVKLGQTVLNYRADLDFVHVPSPCFGPGEKRVEKVLLKVKRNAADIDYLAVRYANGAIDRLPIRERFAQGSTSRWIDLRAGERCVAALALVGDTETFGPKALVEIYGLDY
jgi:hypothetical protein